ncbi:HigA family addiction module antidote protein [Rhizobium sp. TH2]|uniref:HigA family addiction module antitoxin n=1 Tax=Rhizobium sp. TH2 TaxID=2775403 RepID=UPI0021585EE7|nr:HigA family addiction module antitoxin [Rhizobium sp. TH2]UVC09303.1 HigA family addiction module antidote protein [Rhizobium sp. TH2]
MDELKSVGLQSPGVFIKHELDVRGWTQRDLAFILGQTEQQLSPLLAGKRAITPDMALLLGDAFGVNPEFFANLQSQYDLSNARTPDPGVRARAELQVMFPVRDMIRRGWIEDSEASLLRLQVDRFFEVANENEISSISFAAKKTHYDSVPPHQLAWVYRVRQLSRQIQLPPFDSEKLKIALQRLRSLMIDPEAVGEVPRILMECGVRFVVVELLPGAKIDAVCTWLNDESPVIGMSTLYDRLDNFWFVVRHEIEHVLRGDGKGDDWIVDHLVGEHASADSGVEEAERIANAAAADFCVPRQKMESFFTRKHPYFAERDVLGFAALMHVHPGIVVGQLQHKMKRFDYLRKYQVPVRKFLTAKAVTDGWGSVAAAEL